MAGHRALEHADRQGRARSFAQAKAQGQKRFLAQFRQQSGMGAFGADMAGDAMIQRVRGNGLQAGGGGTADEPVEDHGNAFDTGAQDGPGHGRDLAAAQTGQSVQTVAALVTRDAISDHLRLEGQPRVIHASAPADPILRGATIQRMGNGGGGGGVADPHFTGDQKVGLGIHGVPACQQGRQHLGVIHGGRFGEIPGRAVQVDRMHVHLRAEGLGQLVDRRTSVFEIGHHLHRDLGREGRNALGGNAVVAGKDHHLRVLQRRAAIAAPAGIPLRQVLKTAQSRGRLGQLAVAVGRSGGGIGIGPRQSAQDGAEIVKGCGGLGHGKTSLC